MNKKVCCAVLALAFAVAGCAGSAYDTAKKHEALSNYEGADAGVVVVSAGAYKGSGFTSSSVTFRRRNTEDLISTFYGLRKSGGQLGGAGSDFDSPLASGTVFVKRLPPGEYEIASAGGSEIHAGNGYNCTRPLPPVVKFTVHAGEVIYLGRYLTVSSRMNCVNLHILDEQQSDMAVARTRSPMLADEVHSYVPAVELRRQ